MTTQKKQLYDIGQIDDIAAAFDIEILESLDLAPNKRGEVQCSCPVHGGDNPTAFSYCPTRKRWQCFTNHCHKKTASGLVGLVQAVKKLSWLEAIEYILNVTGQKADKHSLLEVDRKIFIRGNKPKDDKAPDKIFPESVLSHADYNVEYFIKERGFTKEILKTFGAFYCGTSGKPLYGRACLTIRNEQGEIIGFTGRKTPIIDKGDRVPKWIHAPEGIELEKHLFGLNIAKDSIKKTGVAILVEGPLDLLRLQESGITNSVSTLGNKFTAAHRSLLIKAGCRTIIDAFDPDAGGVAGAARILDNARLYFNVIDIKNMLKDDIGDLSKETVIKDIKPRIDEIIKKEMKKYG